MPLNIRFQLTLLFLLTVTFFFTDSVNGKEPNWFLKIKEVVIFQSSKQDIERIFERPKIVYSSNDNPKETGWGEIVKYETKDGKLEIYYSGGKCSEVTNKKGWDVDEDIIISVDFKPNKFIKWSELNLDLATFVGYKESDNPTYHYKSSELGIEVATLGKKVISIEYSLTPDMQKLDCENVLKTDDRSINQ